MLHFKIFTNSYFCLFWPNFSQCLQIIQGQIGLKIVINNGWFLLHLPLFWLLHLTKPLEVRGSCSLLYSLHSVTWPWVDCQKNTEKIKLLKTIYKGPWIECCSISTMVLYFSLLEKFMILHYWSCYLSHCISYQIILISLLCFSSKMYYCERSWLFF